jgi:hypothetical protein
MSKKNTKTSNVVRLHVDSLFDESLITLKELHKIHILVVEKYINFCEDVKNRLENVTRKIDFKALAKAQGLDPNFGTLLSYTNFVIPLDKDKSEYMWNDQESQISELDIRKLLWVATNTINNDHDTVKTHVVPGNINTPLKVLAFIFELYYNIKENPNYVNDHSSNVELLKKYRIDYSILRFLVQENFCKLERGKVILTTNKTPDFELAKRVLNLRYFYKLDDEKKATITSLPQKYFQYGKFNNNVNTLKLTKKSRPKDSTVNEVVEKTEEVKVPVLITKEDLALEKEPVKIKKDKKLVEKSNTRTVSILWGLIKFEQKINN